MIRGNLWQWLTGFAACCLAIGATAAPFCVRYTDTVSFSSLPPEIISGQQVTVTFILDNGNSSAANQTWSAADLKSAVFTFNNAQNKSVAIDYSGSPLSPGPSTFISGSFTTNGAGQLQAGSIDWEDFRGPIPNPIATNITGVTLVNQWYIDSLNNVLLLNSGQVGFTSVANDGPATNWSNPVPAGVCGAAPPPPPPATSQPIPTLSEWGIVALSVLVGLFGLALSGVGRRRIP
ncbi:MAG: IPTL-CTERM sorting domain-containing protein [Bradyrhizobium sp.]